MSFPVLPSSPVLPSPLVIEDDVWRRTIAVLDNIPPTPQKQTLVHFYDNVTPLSSSSSFSLDTQSRIPSSFFLPSFLFDDDTDKRLAEKQAKEKQEKEQKERQEKEQKEQQEKEQKEQQEQKEQPEQPEQEVEEEEEQEKEQELLMSWVWVPEQWFRGVFYPGTWCIRSPLSPVPICPINLAPPCLPYVY